jgi:hypothetical protein
LQRHEDGRSGMSGRPVIYDPSVVDGPSGECNQRKNEQESSVEHASEQSPFAVAAVVRCVHEQHHGRGADRELS